MKNKKCFICNSFENVFPKIEPIKLYNWETYEETFYFLCSECLKKRFEIIKDFITKKETEIFILVLDNNNFRSIAKKFNKSSNVIRLKFNRILFWIILNYFDPNKELYFMKDDSIKRRI